ncbi:sulfotransferase family protein [Bacillus taeanensis]|uniref:sulfotransferase family protein n=1 Tax=Bacillus taeanensis TaxID=273032 RepID=UPI0015F11D68|nr:sulfotransferase [Bacillus taeanensis]
MEKIKKENLNKSLSRWPNFYIVGAAKCGTTSLYYYLNSHPNVYMSTMKEPHFFAQVNPTKEQRHIVPVVSNEVDYLKLFEGCEDGMLKGEASPSYLWSEKAPLNIYEKAPDGKIIILLRDPIERAYSHYLMDFRQGVQTKSFYEALKEDYSKKEKGWGVSHLYVELGLYYEQVKRYLETFGDDQIKVLLFEDLKSNRESLMEEICGFLDVDFNLLAFEKDKVYLRYAAPRNKLAQKVMGNPMIRNAAKFVPQAFRTGIKDKVLFKRTEKPKMDENSKNFLKEVYETDLQQLESLLNKDLSKLRKVWDVN